MPDTGEFDSRGTEYGLVMPFVVVTSKGGPYDDGAYVGGYEAGLLAGKLSFLKPKVLVETIHTENLPQVDLIAMRFGYALENVVKYDEEWTSVTFRRGDG